MFLTILSGYFPWITRKKTQVFCIYVLTYILYRYILYMTGKDTGIIWKAFRREG